MLKLREVLQRVSNRAVFRDKFTEKEARLRRPSFEEINRIMSYRLSNSLSFFSSIRSSCWYSHFPL